MLKRVLIVVLILVFLFTHPMRVSSVSVAVNVVFIQPAGETLESAEEITSIQSVHDALAWWNIDESSLVTETRAVDFDVYNGWFTLWPTDTSKLTVLVVDNSVSGNLFNDNGRKVIGLGADHVVWALTSRISPPLMAHELGHALFGLPDLPNGLFDIMSTFYVDMYYKHFVGCISSAKLGKPCKQTFLMYIGVR